jgi:hypothetical protein
MLVKLITGGFLSGYRTYLLGFVMAAQAFVGWAIGDMALVELVGILPELLAGLGLMSLRASVSRVIDGT